MLQNEIAGFNPSQSPVSGSQPEPPHDPLLDSPPRSQADQIAADGKRTSLSPEHRADLESSGLSAETIARAGFYTSNDATVNGRILNWDSPAKNLGPCLAIPFRSMATGELNGFARLKPSQPRTDKKTGKQCKYEQPRGAGARAYVTATAYAARADVLVPIALTEGEKKTLAIEQTGIASIGLTGVSMWAKKRGKDNNGRGVGLRELIDDLAAFAWSGRLVYIVFDTDSRRNANVNREAAGLASALTQRGANVILIELPIGSPRPEDPSQLPRKVGVDDFIFAEGAREFLELLHFATEASTDGYGDR